MKTSLSDCRGVHARFILRHVEHARNRENSFVNMTAKYLLASVAVTLCAFVPAQAANYDLLVPASHQGVAGSANFGTYPNYLQVAQNSGQAGNSGSGQIIPPSVALNSALRYAPGSQGLGVRLKKGARPVYAVKLKSGNRIHRILIDARTGQRVGG